LHAGSLYCPSRVSSTPDIAAYPIGYRHAADAGPTFHVPPAGRLASVAVTALGRRLSHGRPAHPPGCKRMRESIDPHDDGDEAHHTGGDHGEPEQRSKRLSQRLGGTEKPRGLVRLPGIAGQVDFRRCMPSASVQSARLRSTFWSMPLMARGLHTANTVIGGLAATVKSVSRGGGRLFRERPKDCSYSPRGRSD
jgi:hypothetical protein